LGLHAYSAAKAAVINLTRSAATELAKDKIRVNCICAGGMQGILPEGFAGPSFEKPGS